MKIVVAGKGGVGKTTVSGTIARALARAGHDVLALDADTNPMLGVSLGVGPEETDLLVAVRQGLETGETEHERSTEGFVERFGRDAPDGVRLVVASRIERANPGCMCCGVSPESLLTELESDGKIIIGDLEAGIGTVMRLQEGHADVVLVVAQPTAKSLNIARRAVELTDDRGGAHDRRRQPRARRRGSRASSARPSATARWSSCPTSRRSRSPTARAARRSTSTRTRPACAC